MRKINKGDEPPLLARFRQANPDGTWTQCRRSKSRKQQIQDYLIEQQRGLCAYCEIDLKLSEDEQKSDFRVEHFHPKSDDTGTHNWHLDWQNLLGCCHGGSQANVVESQTRASSPDHSCDVDKGSKILDEVILNPLLLDSNLSLFKFERSGAIKVHLANCEALEVDENTVQTTIDELRLDSERLNRLRAAKLNQVNDQLRSAVQNGADLVAARARLARVYLAMDQNQHLSAFHSALKDYLGG